MLRSLLKKLALAAILATFQLSSITLAAEGVATTVTPTAFLENSQVVGTGTQIKAYRVPTIDENGNVRYYDFTIELSIESDGTTTDSASVSSKTSPNVFSNKFIAGQYTDTPGSKTTCTVTTSILNGGRMEVAILCVDPNHSPFSASWTTGPIPGHPYELDLKAAGIDKIPGYQNYSWGKVSNSDSWRWWDFYTANIISARQVGNIIELSDYNNGNKQVGGISLIKK